MTRPQQHQYGHQGGKIISSANQSSSLLFKLHLNLFKFDDGCNYYIITSLTNQSPLAYRQINQLIVLSIMDVIIIIYHLQKAGTFTSIWFITSSYKTDSV